MLDTDPLETTLTSIQNALEIAVQWNESDPTLDDDSRKAIFEYLHYAIDYVTEAQEKKSKCDKEYIEQRLRDVHNI